MLLTEMQANVVLRSLEMVANCRVRNSEQLREQGEMMIHHATTASFVRDTFGIR